MIWACLVCQWKAPLWWESKALRCAEIKFCLLHCCCKKIKELVTLSRHVTKVAHNSTWFTHDSISAVLFCDLVSQELSLSDSWSHFSPEQSTTLQTAVMPGRGIVPCNTGPSEQSQNCFTPSVLLNRTSATNDWRIQREGEQLAHGFSMWKHVIRWAWLYRLDRWYTIILHLCCSNSLLYKLDLFITGTCISVTCVLQNCPLPITVTSVLLKLNQTVNISAKDIHLYEKMILSTHIVNIDEYFRPKINSPCPVIL